MKVNVPVALRVGLAAEAKERGLSVSQFVTEHFAERYNVNIPSRPLAKDSNNDNNE